MSSTSTAGAESNRIPELDGVRGLAILLVLFWHFIYPFVADKGNALSAALFPLFSLTWSGVDLFFVLSGFLLGGQLIDNRDSPNFFKTFYIRRVCRIFPLYFLWVGLSFFVTTFVSLDSFPWLFFPFHDPLPLWTSATFTQNFYLAHQNSFHPGGHWLSVTWSLAIEEQFYLLLPLVIRRTHPRKLPFVLIGFILLAPILRLLCDTSVSAFLITPCRFDALFLGVLAAWFVRKPTLCARLSNENKSLGFLLCIFMLGMVALTARNYLLFLSPVMTIFGLSWIALFYALLIIFLTVSRRSWSHGFFNSWVMRKLGIISFGLFLIHTGVGAIFSGVYFNKFFPILSWEGAAVCFLSVVASIFVATLIHRYLESPVRKFGQRFKY